MESYAQQSNADAVKLKRINACVCGALDGLQLDNTCDVVEKSAVIRQMKIIQAIINPMSNE